jgi:hypothetical protein
VSIDARPNGRAGVARGTALAAIVGLVLAGLIVGTRLATDELDADQTEGVAVNRGSRRTESSAEMPRSVNAAPARPLSSDAPAGEREAEGPDSSSDTPDFDGFGLLSGTVIAGPGAVLPAEGTVIVEPISWLLSPPRGERHELTFTAEQPDFRIEPIPLGAYRVHAEARGMDSRFSDVVLQIGADNHFFGLGDGADLFAYMGAQFFLQSRAAPFAAL